MRKLKRLVAGAAAAAAVTMSVAAIAAIGAGTALADPGTCTTPITPAASDVVGVGSDTIQNLLDQLSLDYNAAHSTGSKLYSWDAVNPCTGATGDTITTKTGATAIARPNGSGQGITALENNTSATVDYARSSRARNGTDPATIAFVALARDAVTWSSRSAASGGTNAPASLSLTQLASIYSCSSTARTWNQVGGTSTATINPVLPQSGSGTRAFFLSAIGVASPGTCVNATTPEENEGTATVLNDANAIFPYSVADFIAQVYHSSGSGANKFGTDVHGVLTLNEASATTGGTVVAPTSVWPLPAPPASVTINSGFVPNFIRVVSDVVRNASPIAVPPAPQLYTIPTYLVPFFGTKSAGGWVCGSGNTTATTDITNYGFLTSFGCGGTS